jgi:hypothetical protein
MLRIKLLFALVILFNFSTAQINTVHPVSWQDSPFNYTAHGNFQDVFVVDLVPDYYDGYLIFGGGNVCNPSVCTNYTRAYSVKTNEFGELMWTNRYDIDSVDVCSALNGDRGNSVIVNHNGQYTCVYSEFSILDEFRFSDRNYISTFDDFGEEVERLFFESDSAFYHYAGLFENFADSSYITFGYTYDSLEVQDITAPPNGFMMQVDSEGQIDWIWEDNDYYSISDVQRSSDGGFWVVGMVFQDVSDCPIGYDYDILIKKLNSEGQEVASAIWGGVCSAESARLFEMAGGDIVLICNFNQEEYTMSTLITWNVFSAVVSIDEFGEFVEVEERKHYFSSESRVFMMDCISTSDGGFLSFGSALNDAFLMYRGYLLKLDENRDSVFYREYNYYPNHPIAQGQNAMHWIRSVKELEGGGYVCVGDIEQSLNDPNPGLITPWIFTVDEFGCLEPGCQYVNEVVIGLENTMTVYPNPVVDFCTIEFNITNLQSHQMDFNDTELVLIDIQGKEVQRISIPNFGNTYQVRLDVQSLPAGSYQAHWVKNNSWLDSVQILK